MKYRILEHTYKDNIKKYEVQRKSLFFRWHTAHFTSMHETSDGTSFELTCTAIFDTLEGCYQHFNVLREAKNPIISTKTIIQL